MKSVVALSIFAAVFCCGAVFAADPAPAAQPAAQPVVAAQPAPAAQPAAAPVKDEAPGIGVCLARGVFNIATGWLEIPRCMIYDNSAIPVFGLIVGIPEGAILTVVRELCGVFDLISFGTTGDLCHGKVFPDTVFQAKWVVPRD